MTTAYTSLLGLALPVTGELSGTWGDTVNNSITSLLDSAIAGTQTLTADTTLTTTTGAANQSRQAILLCSPASANITITAPAQSKIYTVINTSATYTVTVRGVGPTTGVTLGVSEKAVVAWNGSDFIKISNTGGAGVFTSITDSGNLTFTGTGNRITGDFSNATFANRVAFQTSTANGNTIVGAIPNGTSTTSGYWVFNNSDLTNAGRFRMTASSTDMALTADYNGTGTYLPMTFATGGSERVRIDTSGNVGIGTSSPNAKLQVDSSSATYSANIRARNSNFGSGVVGAASGILTVATDMNNIAFYTGSNLGVDGTSVPTNERMRIDSSGNLLVGGTTGADFKLRVNRSGNLGIARFENADTSGLTYDQTQIIVGQAAGSGFMFARYYTSAGGAAQFAFRGDGQMLATVTSIASISDARTKENVRNSSDGLDTVLGLRAVRFDFKEGFSNNRKNQLGFIAQEIEQVFPEAVDVSGQKAEDGSEYKTVAPSTLIPVLVKAIQEQQALIQSLTTRITALEGA